MVISRHTVALRDDKRLGTSGYGIYSQVIIAVLIHQLVYGSVKSDFDDVQ